MMPKADPSSKVHAIIPPLLTRSSNCHLLDAACQLHGSRLTSAWYSWYLLGKWLTIICQAAQSIWQAMVEKMALARHTIAWNCLTSDCHASGKQAPITCQVSSMQIDRKHQGDLDDNRSTELVVYSYRRLRPLVKTQYSASVFTRLALHQPQNILNIVNSISFFTEKGVPAHIIYSVA